MTIKINKEITTIAKAKAVEKALEEFKENYIEEGLLGLFRYFAHMNNIKGCFFGEILRTEVIGFQKSLYSDDISVQIEMCVLDCESAFYRICFFMEQDKESGWWDICADTEFLEIETYTYCK